MRFRLYFIIFTCYFLISADRKNLRSRIRFRRKRRLKEQTSQRPENPDIILQANQKLSDVKLFEGDIVRDEFVELVYGFGKTQKSGPFVDDTMRLSDDDTGMTVAE